VFKLQNQAGRPAIFWEKGKYFSLLLFSYGHHLNLNFSANTGDMNIATETVKLVKKIIK
jgi:hypothetical protein